jgi:uncharacterized membrane protein
VKNLAWMLAVLGALGAILVFATQLLLLGVLAFVGIFASVMAALVTLVVLWSGAPDDTPLSGHPYPGVPPSGSDIGLGSGGGWDAGGGGGDAGGGG